MAYSADILRKGEGVPINYEECVKHYKTGIDKMNPDEMYGYGTMLEAGEGVGSDLEEANKLYKMEYKNYSYKMACYANMLFYWKFFFFFKLYFISVFRNIFFYHQLQNALSNSVY